MSGERNSRRAVPVQNLSWIVVRVRSQVGMSVISTKTQLACWANARPTLGFFTGCIKGLGTSDIHVIHGNSENTVVGKNCIPLHMVAHTVTWRACFSRRRAWYFPWKCHCTIALCRAHPSIWCAWRLIISDIIIWWSSDKKISAPCKRRKWNNLSSKQKDYSWTGEYQIRQLGINQTAKTTASLAFLKQQQP